MGIYQSSRSWPVHVRDLAPVAEHVMQHFRAQEYEVEGRATMDGGWDISLRRGGAFKAVCGLKTALKIDLDSSSLGSTGPVTTAVTGVGIFGQQFVPTLVAWLAFWPVVLTQIWGLVRQAHLDDEAITAVEAALTATGSPPVGAGVSGARHCGQCGAVQREHLAFCTSCGRKGD